MIKLSSLQKVHKGQPAAVLGGGTSLPEDMRRLPSGSLLIAVNDHALHIGVKPDYMVFMDDPNIKPSLIQVVDEWHSEQHGLRVTEGLAWTDVDLRGVVRPDLRSGIWSAWFAMYLGCAPILLCGMDLYTNAVKYCHDKDEIMGHKYIFDEPLEKHLNDWSSLIKYKDAKHIRAMSGPLSDLFGVYESNML